MRTRASRTSVAIVVAALLSAALCSCAAAPGPAPTPSPTPLPAADCANSVRTGPLPEWARAGFSDDGRSFRHVEGLHGFVVGVLFGYPLSSPARPGRLNKILWVAHDPASGRLGINAQLDGSGPVIERTVGFGGGQSIIDLPSPGCWRLTLHWGDNLADVVDLPYLP
jgi:hypothetical protein